MLILGNTPSHALEVQSVRFGAHPDRIRLVVDMDDVVDFRVFVLAEPKRMVIDVPNFQWNAGDVKPLKSSLISDIRQGKLMAGISRIVFDLTDPILVQKAFFLPQTPESSSRLVIDYKKVDLETFQSNKKTIHGTLRIDDHAQVTSQLPSSDFNIADYIPTPPPNEERPKSKPIAKKGKKPLIILDPGHGGVDPGAVAHKHVYEKHIVLSIAKELKKQLLDSGRYRVKLTREKDVFIKLKERVKFAQNAQGDLFISLHADSIARKNVSGSSIYTLSKKASDKQTAALAKKENQADLMAGVDLHVEDKQVAFILGDFLMNETMNQSKFFANTLVERFHNQKLKTLQTPHRYAGFAVLKAPSIPSVLIETGFMSNEKEARLLRQKEHQKKIATAIREGIDAYFVQVAVNENN